MTSASKTEHQRNIRRFHHKVKSTASPSDGVKTKDLNEKTSNEISKSCDFDVKCGGTHDEQNHQRSNSEPNEMTTKIGIDLKTRGDVKTLRCRGKRIMVEDLKTALFQD